MPNHLRLTKSISFAASLLLFFSNAAFSQGKPLTTNTELKRLYAIDQLPVYRENSQVLQISSYDRTGGNNDGFEGTYSYLSKTGDGSLVVFEAEGKGIIERTWTPTPTDDTLNFYFNGSQSPSYSIKYSDLFSGKIYPFLSPVVGHKVGGFYSYVPIPFENGCRIVFRGKKILFHQFQYRKLGEDVKVETFRPGNSEKEQLEQVASLWNKNSVRVTDIYKAPTRNMVINKTLSPGQTLVLAEIPTGGRIVGIEFANADVFEGLDNSIDMKLTWDNEKSPALFAPVADFYGFAFGSKSMKSLLLGVDSSNRAYSFLPMPFDKNAKIELRYRKNASSQKPVKLNATITYQPIKRNPATEGKLYAMWKNEEPALGKPYVFLEGEGKGHFVGTLLQSQGKTYTEFTEFFEGDDSTVIDGINSIHGTGSEDYFNGGWYAQPGGWVERLGASLHGCLDYSLPYSRTGGYRFYLTDKLPFSRSIYHSMEHGPEKNNRAVSYTSLAFYYANKPVQQTGIPNNATAKVFIPDTLTFYARLMNHLTYEGKMHLKDGNAVLEKNEEGITNVDLSEISKGEYELFLNLVAPNNANSEVALEFNSNGKSNSRKLVGGKRIKDNFYFIDTINIRNTRQPLKLYFKANNNKVILHRVMLVKKGKYSAL
ncbi:DUF2961 domain-containing protein [Flavisolibacter sp. BT320]|nr:DUF2961 domain-containing protein [Flavisolibacter longurius]